MKRREGEALTTGQVAVILGVSASSVKNWAGTRRLSCYRLSSGVRRFPRAELVRWLEENGMPEEMVARARGGAG